MSDAYSQIQLRGGVQMPALALGTWPMKDQESTTAVRQGLELGYRHIDTAENYENEEAVGRALAGCGIERSQLFVTTKFNQQWHEAGGVRQAAQHALRRLGLEYLDLFLIHWPNPKQGSYVQAFEQLAQLIDEGVIRAAGVSNFKPAHLQAVLDAGLVPAVNQIQVDPERQSAPWQEFNTVHGVVTQAYSPLGRLKSDFLFHPAIVQPAAQYGKTPAQITLRWHLQSGRAVTAKSAHPARQAQNLDLFDFTLSAEQLAAINALDTGAGPFMDSDNFGH